MPRSTEGSQAPIPLPPDTQAWRHYGDGFAGLINTSRIQGFYATAGDYRDVAVSSTGELLATLDASGVTIGTVAQGAAGASAWLVAGPLTDTQLRAAAVPVSLAALPALATGTNEIGNVKNSGTFAVQASLAAETTKVIGTVNQGTSPWVTSASVSNFPATQAVSNAGTFAVQAAVSSDTVGIAKDATFTAAVGTVSDTPAAYTVLDQLTKLRKAAESELKLVQQLIALQTPALPRKTQPTLLHRS